ncbi:MAG TPA: hypothetical protein PLE19_21385 [Planctomycetota bacterium]|nr:hypothetical protein [Planctomycetota bacterium]HRR83105.1 hypothetical protein [Planctomycetota bacterium]HRT97110.1 hypothetical protein [Planctomycetota bacterium]
MSTITRRLALGVGIAVALAFTQGCASWEGGLPGFLGNRVKDALECVDLGVTVSDKAQFSFYAAFMSAVPFGYGHVEGTFVGVGGGDIGAMRIYYSHYGLGVYGRERTGWGNCLWRFPEFEAGVHDERMNCQGVGPLGILMPPFDGRPAGRPT